jgi:hypothetical protein
MKAFSFHPEISQAASLPEGKKADGISVRLQSGPGILPDSE